MNKYHIKFSVSKTGFWNKVKSFFSVEYIKDFESAFDEVDMIKKIKDKIDEATPVIPLQEQ